MSNSRIKNKDPDEVLDFPVIWSNWLGGKRCQAKASDDTLTSPLPRFFNGMQVWVEVADPQDPKPLPGGLLNTATYYVRDAVGARFRLAASLGGPPVDVTSDGECVVLPDAIETSDWVPETGIVLENDSATSGVATPWFSGGTDDEDYGATNEILTYGGRIGNETLTIRVREK